MMYYDGYDDDDDDDAFNCGSFSYSCMLCTIACHVLFDFCIACILCFLELLLLLGKSKPATIL